METSEELLWGRTQWWKQQWICRKYSEHEIEKDDSGGEDNSELKRSIVNMEMEKEDDSELERSIVNMETGRD